MGSDPDRGDDASGPTEHDRQREAAARLIDNERSQFLHRIHRLLGRDTARRITDTEEILSTAQRRVDDAITRGVLRAQSDKELYSFVHRVIERAIFEKAKQGGRLTARETIAGRLRELGAADPTRSEATREQLIDLGSRVDNPIDREIVHLLGRGLNAAQVGASLGMSPERIRQRWHRLKKRLLMPPEERNGADGEHIH